MLPLLVLVFVMLPVIHALLVITIVDIGAVVVDSTVKRMDSSPFQLNPNISVGLEGRDDSTSGAIEVCLGAAAYAHADPPS